MTTLVIDDLRTFPFRARYARSSAVAVAALTRAGAAFDAVYFDFDLHGDDTVAPVIDVLCELATAGTPVSIGRCVVHTSNPAGRDMVRVRLVAAGYDVEVIDAHIAGARIGS
jgi:hypothetical protein